jgi:hypothetical protein
MTNPKRPRDPNQLAKLIIGIASGEEADERPVKDESAVSLGRKGGRARAAAMSPERRKEIAKKAAAKRWKGLAK